MRIAVLISFSVITLSSIAQVESDYSRDEVIHFEDAIEEPSELDSNEVFEFFNVTKRALFGKGDSDLMNFIADNVKYPQEALDSNIQGTVFLDFVVEPDSTISTIKSIKKPYGYGLEEEAKRVLKLTDGLWSPAMMRDKNVRMRFRLPIKFSIY